MPEITFRDYVDYRLDAICRQLEKMELDIDSLKETRATLAGKASQTSVLVANLMALAGLVLALINLMRS